MSNGATQRIFTIRRDYNNWVANETLEDYALRYTPSTFRKWSEFRVANTAFGAVSFLALEAIGATIALTYGFWNALWAIVVVGIIIFLTGLPISYYAARYGLDMDLLTRGGGFGYLGSTITSLIYATFTFIFFALEAVIMAMALELYFGMPLSVAYLVSSLAIIPLVTFGVTLISRLQLWTQPLWLALLALPFVAIASKEPQLYVDFVSLAGSADHADEFSWTLFGAASTVCFALAAQIGEQVDFLRFLPIKTRANRWRWWSAVLISGPGWIVPGMLKMMGGAFLAFVALQMQVPAAHALEPTQMYLAGYSYVFSDVQWALLATTLFVLLSQIKINVTNAYAGSLAWSNFFARLTHSHPGRVVWLMFNVLIAILLMALGVFEALESVLGLYANLAIAWVGALVADLVINKPLGLSPRGIEFKRGYLYDINPVGIGAMLIATGCAITAYTGVLGEILQAFAAFIALLVAFLTAPLIAWATRGRYYIARPTPTEWKPGESVRCVLCENTFESEDMAVCPAYAGAICSLCCTLDARCHDRCKPRASAVAQMQAALARLLPASLSTLSSGRIGHYFLVFVPRFLLLLTILGVVFYQEAVVSGLDVLAEKALQQGFVKALGLLTLITAVGSWWVVLEKESRSVAQEESNRQTLLLMKESEAHRVTDTRLQEAKEAAESANQAKTRYVTGMTHELRTPLNSMLGYVQILLKDNTLPLHRRDMLAVIQRSGDHMISLVDGLLDLARIEAGKLRLEPGELAFPEFLEQVIKMVNPEADAKGLDLRLEMEGRLPATVNADAKRLRQILINLLANAIKFTDCGRVTLRVTFAREIAYFSVDDTGVGIAAPDLERIFLPFERAASGRTRSGAGLGLTITYLLTELMGGEITVKSEPGVGSSFNVRLYLREITTPTKIPTPGQEVMGYHGRRRCILVVDDQAVQRHLLSGLLMPLGFEVREAASAEECLASLDDAHVDAVLMDVEMPGMNGWETCRRLREAGHETLPVIMVSANLFAKVDELTYWAGCQGFIDKPVMETELLALLGRVLTLRWQYRVPSPASKLRKAPTDDAFKPPPHELSALRDLAEIGHVMAIRRKLDEMDRIDPRYAAFTTRLRAPLKRFDLDMFVNLLGELPHALH